MTTHPFVATPNCGTCGSCGKSRSNQVHQGMRGPVEGSGNLGLDNRPWKKTFPSIKAMIEWVQEHEASIVEVRDVARPLKTKP